MKHGIRMKLQVWIVKLEYRNLMHFPKLNAMPNFVGILCSIQAQFKTRYENIEKLEIWFSVFDTPFTVDFKDIQDAALQMELIDLRCDRRLHEKFMNR
ncbi:General transcription factor II-I repeat domain-containing protein 2 [Blattella germanica]|nr:General transcription factor II-I repeat domain-containing protein 2 [Blattella germanica]